MHVITLFPCECDASHHCCSYCNKCHLHQLRTRCKCPLNELSKDIIVEISTKAAVKRRRFSIIYNFPYDFVKGKIVSNQQEGSMDFATLMLQIFFYNMICYKDQSNIFRVNFRNLTILSLILKRKKLKIFKALQKAQQQIPLYFAKLFVSCCQCQL